MAELELDWSERLEVQQTGPCEWRIPRQGPMRVDGVIFASDALIGSIRNDASLGQVANVACLPGIVKASIAMPDIHLGYGFAVGGVAAFEAGEGIISPGGVGYDINCGVRLLRTRLEYSEVRDRIPGLLAQLFGEIPAGVGAEHADLRLDAAGARRVAAHGARWAVERGFGLAEDLEAIEDGGCLPGADFDAVSSRAFERGRGHLGSLGSGNHFLEVGYVDEVYDPAIAACFGLHRGMLTVLIHTGSRGFGYQICDDYLRQMQLVAERQGIELPDRQLCCARLSSEDGQAYLAAMTAAANFAFANRQVISHRVREVVEQAWQVAPRQHGIEVVYDICHNIARREVHSVDGEERELMVHRKGATRAFPAGHPAVPDAYRSVGQPVLVPGDMGRYSYVLAGSRLSPPYAFASCCHGAGRLLSRAAARRALGDRRIQTELQAKGIRVLAANPSIVDEECPEAYKDVADVVTAVEGAGLAARVARLRPVGVIKG